MQAATYDLLKELQCFFLPDADVSFADNISSARKEIGDLVHLFGSLAQRHPAASALIVPPNVDRISTDATTGLLDFVGAWSPLRADAPVSCPSILQPDQGNENTAVDLIAIDSSVVITAQSANHTANVATYDADESIDSEDPSNLLSTQVSRTYTFLQQLQRRSPELSNPCDASQAWVRKALAKTAPEIADDQVYAVAVLLSSTETNEALPHLCLLREQASFLRYGTKRTVREFYLFLQMLLMAAPGLELEVDIADDVDATLPVFRCTLAKIVDLCELKSMLPHHMLCSDDGFRYPDETLQHEAVVVDGVRFKCYLEPVRRTLYGSCNDIQSLSSSCPDALRKSLTFCLRRGSDKFFDAS